MESEGATKSDDVDIPRQLWDESVFMHFLYAQYLALDIKSKVLENIHNADLYYWMSQEIKSFICHTREIYGK